MKDTFLHYLVKTVKKILLLNGSPNTNGNTYFLLNEIAKHCTLLGAKCEIINIPKILKTAKHPFCISCSSPCNKSCYKDTELEDCFNKAAQADAIVFGSPVYFGSITAQLKAFLDKTRDVRANKAWLGKKCAAVTVGGSPFGGQELTIRTIHDILLVNGMTIVGDGYDEFDCGHKGVCARCPADKDENAIKRTEIIAHRLVLD